MEIKKTVIAFLATAALLGVFYLLPGRTYRLVDASTGQSPAGFSVTWPGLTFFNAPFAGVSFYMQKLTNQPAQVLSWLLWLAALAGLSGAVLKKPLKRVVWDIDVTWLVFLTAEAFLIFIRQPSPRLVSPETSTVVNFHSHTRFSKDGIVAPAQNSYYHKNAGFDVNFVTEHNSELSYLWFYPGSNERPLILPGMQANTENISLLLLGGKQIAENDLDIKDRPIAGLVKWAHDRGMVVICPHWWKWGRPSWDYLRSAGVDGFEIYNLNYRQFTDTERAELVKFCGDNKLITVGSTDWKGFGWACDVWTALDMPKSKASPSGVIGYLAKHKKTSVLVYQRDEPSGALRYIFEPFVGLYLYFAALGAVELLSWLFWAVAAIAVLSFSLARRAAASAALAFLLFLTVKYSLALFASWYNAAIAEIVLPLMLLLSVGWVVFILNEQNIQ
jgi:hypothetical protein